jgi:hypothetical protein
MFMASLHRMAKNLDDSCTLAAPSLTPWREWLPAVDNRAFEIGVRLAVLDIIPHLCQEQLGSLVRPLRVESAYAR